MHHALRLALLYCTLSACGDDGGGGGAGTTGSSSAGSGSGSGSGSGAGSLDACNIVTQADATALFGQPAVRDPQSMPFIGPGLLGECMWTWDTDSSNQLLQFYVWDGPEYHSVPDGSQPLAVGEQGYIVVSDGLGIDIEWIQDGRTIVLSYFNVGPDVPELATRVEPMKTLAQQVLGKL